MFLKETIFDQLFCCRKKPPIDDRVEEEIVLQHTNNNKTEYITSSQLLERLKGGTTAVVALVREKRLVVAWLGDSLALLVRRRTPVHIVRPHKPDDPSEQKRIENAGGCVVNIQGTWRVLGQLAVSRAIGDSPYKPYVTSECDIKSLEICGDEDFLILACDGLWDSLIPETAVEIVFSYLLKNDGDTDGVGRCLVQAARTSGSQDNITAVVVFLRSIDILMEEESARIAQGLVPETNSFVMPQKGALPPSIHAIFTPPEDLKASMAPETIVVETNGNGTAHHVGDGDITPEIPPRDYDSDEGVGEEIDHKETESRTNGVQPTDEEVDAALAELDSIPDGAADDLEEEVEGWSYFKMEPQQNREQVEDMLAAGTEMSVDGIPTSTVDVEFSKPMEIDVSAPTKEDSPSGSPRSVEGFVTSVELNTPEESFSTNLAINQSTDYFGAPAVIEQTSGPFSVYVSSSPEPSSVDSVPVHVQSHIESDSAVVESTNQPDLPKSSPIAAEERVDMEIETRIEESTVEIVHAQSTVEVMADNVVEMDIPQEDTVNPIPEMMTASFNGDLPTESLIPPVMDDAAPSIEVKQPVEVYDFDKLSLVQRSPEPVSEDNSALLISSPDTVPIEDALESPDQFIPNTQAFAESAPLEHAADINTHTETDLRSDSFAEEIAPSIEYAALHTITPDDDGDQNVEKQFSDYPSNPAHYDNEIPMKSFEVSLDSMAASFHEDQIPSSELVASLKENTETFQENVETEQIETPLVEMEANFVEQELTPVQTPTVETEICEETIVNVEASKIVSEEAVVESVIKVNEEDLVEKVAFEEEVVEKVAFEEEVVEKVAIEEQLVEKVAIEEEFIEKVAIKEEKVAETKPTAAVLSTSTVPKPAAKKAAAPRTSLSKPTPPKPSPRTAASKPAPKTTVASKGPTNTKEAAPKRSSYAAPLRSQKTESAKPTVAHTKAPLTSRVTSSTARTTTTARSMTSSTSRSMKTTSTTTTTAAKPRISSTAAAPRTKPSPASTTTTAPKRVPLASRTTTSTASKPKTSSASPATTTDSTKRTTAPRLSSATGPKRAPTTTTSSASTRVPLAARSTVSRTSRTTTTTSSTMSSSTATKDSKNSTNRILSANTTKPRNLSKYAKTPILKKKEPATAAAAGSPKSALTNGHESKAAKDAEAVESKQKLIEVETEKVTEEVILNGDH